MVQFSARYSAMFFTNRFLRVIFNYSVINRFKIVFITEIVELYFNTFIDQRNISEHT